MMSDEAECVIDCRSDVLTQPCDDMKAKMMKATFGFDGYNESQDTIGEFTFFCALLLAIINNYLLYVDLQS